MQLANPAVALHPKGIDLRLVNPVSQAIREGSLPKARRLVLAGNEAIAKAGDRAFTGEMAGRQVNVAAKPLVGV